MDIVIVSGGNIEDGFASAFLNKISYDRIIAVDKGAEFCYRQKIMPSVLTGDFDTLQPEILEYYEKRGVPVRRFRPEKDAADIEIALNTAEEMLGKAFLQERESSMVTILGGTGTRLDHMMGTLYSMASLGPGIPCQLIDVCNRIRMLWPGIHYLKHSECFGPYVSLLPIGGSAEGITLTGFKYPLAEHTMTCDNSLGVSNELVSETGTISFRRGLLACFETRDG